MTKTTCVICADNLTFAMITDCDHICCLKCGLRMRQLIGDLTCPFCKKANTQAIFTENLEATVATTKLDKCTHDKQSKGFFTSKEVRDEANNIRACVCPVCSEQAPSLTALKKHVQTHSKELCPLCVEHRKVFPSEHVLFTPEDLIAHNQGRGQHRSGGFKGHPECTFCETRFYADEELFQHLTKQHERCHICDKQGRAYEYYKNYKSLEDHFQCEHFLCEDPVCLRQRFIVFPSALELATHTHSYHPSSAAASSSALVGSVVRVGKGSRGIAIDPREIGLSVPSFRNELPQIQTQHTQRQKKGPKPFKPDFALTRHIRDNPTTTSSTTDIASTSTSQAVSSTTTTTRDSKQSNKKQTSNGSPTQPPPTPDPSSAASTAVANSGAATHLPPIPQTREELERRNRELILNMKECLCGDNVKFATLRDLSGKFRNGELSARHYYHHFVTLLGPHGGTILFPELVALLPDPSRRNELFRVYQEATNQLPTATTSTTTTTPRPSATTSTTPASGASNSSFPSLQAANPPSNVIATHFSTGPSANVPAWVQSSNGSRVQPVDFPSLPPAARPRLQVGATGKKKGGKKQGGQGSAWVNVVQGPRSNSSSIQLINNSR